MLEVIVFNLITAIIPNNNSGLIRFILRTLALIFCLTLSHLIESLNWGPSDSACQIALSCQSIRPCANS